MSKFILKQTGGVETINASLIHKLYETVLREAVSANVDVQGTLFVDHAYEEEVEYLRNRFLNLTINMTGDYYIKFVSPSIQTLLATKIGDGIGVSYIQAANSAIATNGTNNWFGGNSTSVTFPEFKYFTETLRRWNQTSGSPGASFLNWTGLRSIDVDSITNPVLTRIPYATFQGCTNLTTVNGLGNVLEIAGYAFNNCTSLTTLDDISSVTTIGDHAFHGAFSSGNFDLSEVRSIGAEAFKDCGLTSIKVTSALINTYFNGFPDGLLYCKYVENIDSDFENWNYQIRIVGFPNLLPLIIYQPKVTNINNSINTYYTSTVDSWLNAGWLYFPRVTQIYNNNWYMNHNLDFRSCFAGSRTYSGFTLMYLKDITKISSFAFTLCSYSMNVVINNTVPPAIVTRDGTTEVSYFTCRDNHDYPLSPDRLEIYVPDSSVNTYKTAWPNFSDRIHSIHDLNSGIIYSTKQDFISAGKPVLGLIAEYLGLNSSELALFVSSNNLTYYSAS